MNDFKKNIFLTVIIVFLVFVTTKIYYNVVDIPNNGVDVDAKESISKTDNKKVWLSWGKTDKPKENEIDVSQKNVNIEIEEKNNEEENLDSGTINSNKDLTICNENGKIMVLMYHKFAKKSNDKWVTTFKDFKKDLELLYENDYYPINMNEYIEGKIDVPYGKTPVVLTFDDGTPGQLSFEWVNDELKVKEDTAVKVYQDFVKEHPDFPMKGTFYIMSTNFFGAKGTLKQRLEYLVSQGFEIGNKTKNYYILPKATSSEKVIEEVGGLAKFVDELIPGYVISSFSIPGGSMTKKYEDNVYSGEYKGYKYNNKGVVLLFNSKPTLSPINKDLDLKKISRVKASGSDDEKNGLEYWIKYFKENPNEKYISDGDVNTFIINSSDKENVIDIESIRIK